MNNDGPRPSSKTASEPTRVPASPGPRADQLVPFQRAMPRAGTPPAKLSRPPAYRAGPVPSSKTIEPYTISGQLAQLASPPPTSLHAFPSQRAMLRTETPPASVPEPATYNAEP